MTTSLLAQRVVFCITLFASPVFAAEPASAPAASAAEGQPGGRRAYPPKMGGSEVEVYKTVGDVKLNAYVYKPADWKPTDKRAAVVFFFGGGWTSGSPAQFEHACRHLASRGMVAVAADYRVKSRQNVTPVECVADAKSAVRWLRANAAKFGVDPARIAAGGSSAGGHLAAAAGVLEGFDEKSEDAAVSSKPDALVLFNPAVNVEILEKRLGGERAKEIAPVEHVKPGVPPAIVFHGTDDKTVPYATAEAFTAAMKKAGNRCDLVSYEGIGHGFFNFRGKDGGETYKDALAKTDEFFVSLGYLKATSAPAGGK